MPRKRKHEFKPNKKLNNAENLCDFFQFYAKAKPFEFVPLEDAYFRAAGKRIKREQCEKWKEVAKDLSRARYLLKHKYENYIHYDYGEAAYRAFVDADDRARNRTPQLVRRHKRATQNLVLEAAEIDRSKLEGDTLKYMKGVLDPLVKIFKREAIQAVYLLPEPGAGD